MLAVADALIEPAAAAGGFDFGDAPSPYPTTDANFGARHEAVGPTLGATRDEEVDGQPADDADGDGADEDGVTFGPITAGQLNASVTVNVQNAPNGARLDAWIDFNGDGSWSGLFDQIAGDVLLREGDNTISFDVPSWAAGGSTYARFRLSTEGGLGVGGSAADGEVEDFPLAIIPILPTGDISLIEYFDLWNGGIILSTDVSGLTYHPPSGNLYIADGEINEIPAIFNGDNVFEISRSGDTVFREITSNNSEPTGITYNEFDGFFYMTNDIHQTLQRYDDNLNEPLATITVTDDVANATDLEGVTSNP
ncbi:MAG: hypothetical protein IIA67_06035, partial [Planctomycetes bacterium]|nr:hypothetical protein [Planctomycetota bacterium]